MPPPRRRSPWSSSTRERWCRQRMRRPRARRGHRRAARPPLSRAGGQRRQRRRPSGRRPRTGCGRAQKEPHRAGRCTAARRSAAGRRGRRGAGRRGARRVGRRASWVVVCSRCKPQNLLISIPLSSNHLARLLRQDHSGRRWRPLDRCAVIRRWLSRRPAQLLVRLLVILLWRQHPKHLRHSGAVGLARRRGCRRRLRSLPGQAGGADDGRRSYVRRPEQSDRPA